MGFPLLLELPRGRGENLPPTRLLCCMVGTQGRLKQDKQGSWSGCITDLPPFMFPAFPKKDSTKQKHHKYHILALLLALRVCNMHVPEL